MASRCSQVNVIRQETEVDCNPPSSVRRKRSKKSAVAVRQLCPNLRTDGAVRCAALRASSALHTQVTFSSTFRGIHRYPWRVDWFPTEPKGSVGKPLVFAIGSYPTCTDCNWVLRLMGLANCKNDPAYHMTVEYCDDSTRDSDDLRLDIPALDVILSSRTSTARKHPSNPTNPEHDWLWILHEIACGKDAAELTRKLTSRRADRPNSMYCAQRTVGVASVKLWLVESVPIDDVVTLLEVRCPLEIPLALCSACARKDH